MVNMNSEKLRKLWKQHHNACDRLYDLWATNGYQYPPPMFPVFPEELRALTCGANKASGGRCKQRVLFRSGRCKWHGGKSTGPRTETGKQKSKLNLINARRLRWPAHKVIGADEC